MVAKIISARLGTEKVRLEAEFRQYHVKSCVLDNILDDRLAREIYQAFPSESDMKLRKSLRERKYVSANMDRHNTLLKEITFAFQDPTVVRLLAEITGLKSITADSHLYAGGVSLMGGGHFLGPHLDNSHDKDRENYRVLNLLYYVTPDWKEEYGGNLEL